MKALNLHQAMGYARLAIGVVLDRHEITVLPDRVHAVPMSDGSIGLIYETARCSASGRFVGDQTGGLLHLDRIVTMTWDVSFGTRDHFRGADSNGTPRLVGTESATMGLR